MGVCEFTIIVLQISFMQLMELEAQHTIKNSFTHGWVSYEILLQGRGQAFHRLQYGTVSDKMLDGAWDKTIKKLHKEAEKHV